MLLNISCSNPIKNLENPRNLSEYMIFSIRTEALSSKMSVSENPKFIADYHSFPSLVNLSTLEGKYFYITESNTFYKKGNTPSLDFSISGRNIIPNDNKTLEMFTLFLLFETAVDYMEKKLNLKAQDMLAAFKEHDSSFRKFEIRYSPIDIDYLTLKGKIKYKDNYQSTKGKFSFTKAATTKGIPSSFNGLIVFHEFGHALWDYKLKFNSQDNIFMRGVNEGFADWISYSITGSANILKASQYEKKNMNASELRDFSKFNYTLNDINNMELCSTTNFIYCIGSLFANALYKAKRELKKENRDLIIQIIFSNLIKFSNNNSSTMTDNGLLKQIRTNLEYFLKTLSYNEKETATVTAVTAIKKQMKSNFNIKDE